MRSRRLPMFTVALGAAVLLATTAGTGLAQSPTPITVTDAEGNPVAITDASRIVSIGGGVTEIIYALGAQGQLVGVDQSSFYPAEALVDHPNIGYGRFLAAEPVLAVNPTLVIGTTEAGPPDTLAQIRDSGITMLILPVEPTVDSGRARIRALGQVLGKAAEAEALVAALETDLADASTLLSGATTTPRVMFILPAGPTTVLVAGSDTEAQTMIELAGGTNAVTGYPGYVPLTPEAAVAAAPDVILTSSDGLQALGGIDGFLQLPGLAQTPAGQARRVIDMDTLYLLSMGPRTGQAAQDLARLLHPELAQ